MRSNAVERRARCAVPGKVIIFPPLSVGESASARPLSQICAQALVRSYSTNRSSGEQAQRGSQAQEEKGAYQDNRLLEDLPSAPHVGHSVVQLLSLDGLLFPAKRRA